MVQTLLIGNFGDNNLGDELILLAALRDYPEAVVMTNDPSFSQNFTGTQFKTVPFPPTGFRSLVKYYTDKNYRARIKELRNLEITKLIFPGGGLFAIKWRACLLWFLIFRHVTKASPKAEIRFEHQGVDKNLGVISRYLTKKVFQKADYISVRDESSAQALHEIQILKSKIQVVEDRVVECLQNLDTDLKNKQRIVLINARKGVENTQIKAILESYPDCQFKFVAFAPSDLNCLPTDFSPEIVMPKTAEEVFRLFESAEIMIGERFHSLVLGYHYFGSDKTFSIRAPYSEKVASFCKTYGIKKF